MIKIYFHKMAPLDNIGRVAQLCDLISKPELNGKYVVLESYNSEKDRYQVKVLPSPNESNDVRVLLVKLSNIQFSGTIAFADKIPEAAIQHVSIVESFSFVSGTVLRLTQDYERSAKKAPVHKLKLMDDCRVVGETLSDDTDKIKIQSQVVIAPSTTDTVIEFSNIEFCDVVTCGSCGHITFHDCRFGKNSVLMVGDGLVSTTVQLVTCAFEENVQAGIIVAVTSQAIVLNCKFLNCRFGVIVSKKEGATTPAAIIKHCSFHNCNLAITPGYSQSEVESCLFVGGRTAIFVNKRCAVRVIKCRVQDCFAYGVEICGPEYTRVHIQDCVIAKCARGVFISTGKVKVSIVNSQITGNKVFGVCLFINLKGRIILSECTVGDNEQHDIVNLCNDQGIVTIDNIEQPRFSGKDRMDQLCKVRGNLLEEPCAADEETLKEHGYTPSVKTIRTLKRSGLAEYAILCSYCRAVEPCNGKFNVCGICKNAPYCSSECQATHWKEHKKECGKVKYY